MMITMRRFEEIVSIILFIHPYLILNNFDKNKNVIFLYFVGEKIQWNEDGLLEIEKTL